MNHDPKPNKMTTPRRANQGILILLISISVIFQTRIFSQSVSGHVWYDVNFDGFISASEPPMANIPVFLTTCSGQFVNAVYSDANGNYQFMGLPAGSYKVFFNISGLGPLYKFTYVSPSTDNHAQANGFTLCSLITTQGTQTFNAGIIAVASIGDRVWEDLNYDGFQNPGEPGIGNVLIQLIRQSDAAVIGQTVTSADGSYSFNNIFPGQYYLEFKTDTIVSPPILQTGDDLNSDVTETYGPGTTGTITVGAGQAITYVDAGFYKCARFCGTVFYDQNQNDTLDLFENGINGIKIELWSVSPEDTILQIVKYTGRKPGTPSDDGYYEFCVSPGYYYLKFVIQPALDIVAVDPFESVLINHDSDITHANGQNTTSTIQALSGSDHCSTNGGFFCNSFITARVWYDENQNGQRDNPEASLSGVAISLYKESGVLVETRESDWSGVCRFDSLKAGNYYVVCPPVPGMTFTVAHHGSEFTDSDIDNTYGPGSSGTIIHDECNGQDETGIGLKASVLPLLWGDIEAESKEDQAVVRWQVFHESDIKDYVIFISEDGGRIWNKMGIVLASANGSADAEYTFTFPKPVSDIMVRITARGFDDTEKYSPMARLMVPSENFRHILPNPADDFLQVYTYGDKTQFSILELYNAAGQKVMTKELAEGATTLIGISQLAEGLYYAVWKSDGAALHSNKVVISR